MIVLPQIVTNGTDDFKRLAVMKSATSGYSTSLYVSILAESASILFTSHGYWHGQDGIIVEIDHFDSKMKRKGMNVKICNRLEIIKEQNCTVKERYEVWLFYCKRYNTN
jgi:hypothetical protein